MTTCEADGLRVLIDGRDGTPAELDQKTQSLAAAGVDVIRVRFVAAANGQPA